MILGKCLLIAALLWLAPVARGIVDNIEGGVEEAEHGRHAGAHEIQAYCYALIDDYVPGTASDGRRLCEACSAETHALAFRRKIGYLLRKMREGKRASQTVHLQGIYWRQSPLRGVQM